MTATKIRTLVTGASGVVGAALTETLRSRGDTVSALSTRDGDLKDWDVAMSLILERKPQVVFHLAARVAGLMGNSLHQGSMYRDNVLINTHVIEAARLAGVRKVIAVGTTAIYPDGVPLPMSESHIWMGPPHGSEAGYAHAKRGMLAQLEAYKEEFGLDYAYCVLTNVYGPQDRFDERYGHVIPSLISKFHRAGVDSGSVTVWGDGTPTRDFIYSSDAASALVAASEHLSGAVNVATGHSVPISRVVDVLSDVVGGSVPVVWDSSKPNGQQARRYDVSRLEAIGWAPRVSLEQGLSQTFEWFERNPTGVRR